MQTAVIRKVRTVSEVCPGLADSTSGTTGATDTAGTTATPIRVHRPRGN